VPVRQTTSCRAADARGGYGPTDGLRSLTPASSYNLVLPLHRSEALLEKAPASLSVAPWFDQLRVVLVRSRNPLNIGAAARAMSNFGFRNLRLVTPWEPSYLGARSAVGASQVLLDAEVFGSVAEAVADCGLVVGTSAVGERELHHPLHALEQGAELMRQQLAAAPVALLFGSEKFGLSNEDLSHCHWLLRIPTRDEHISMNLGQAVAVCLYELARGAAHALPSSGHTPAAAVPAVAMEVERIAQVWFDALCTSGYVQSPGEAAAQEKLRRMLRRLNLEKNDAEVWLGMMRQILWKMKHPRREDH
jgi:TrmH family RNA methyltransferase